MALPTFLIIEMRLAFKSCAQQHKSSSVRYFSSSTLRNKKTSPRDGQPTWPYDGALANRKSVSVPEHNQRNSKQEEEQKDLVTQEPGRTAVGTERKVPVPMRVIPKPEIGPGMTLTPRQRLHVEIMTRRPPTTKEKKIFRERLQVYHIGAFKENILAILKVSSIVSACAVTFVFAPAHYAAGSAPWLVALIWLAGFVPGIACQYLYGPWVNRVFLDLPDKARESPKAAMEYAKNLPSDAMLDIRYLKLWGLEGSVKASTSELIPTRSKFLQPLSFTWREDLLPKRKTSTWVPTSFYTNSETAFGASSKNTVPGVWEAIYRRIVKAPEKEAPKWKSHREPYET